MSDTDGELRNFCLFKLYTGLQRLQADDGKLCAIIWIRENGRVCRLTASVEATLGVPCVLQSEQSKIWRRTWSWIMKPEDEECQNFTSRAVVKTYLLYLVSKKNSINFSYEAVSPYLLNHYHNSMTWKMDDRFIYTIEIIILRLIEEWIRILYTTKCAKGFESPKKYSKFNYLF